MDLKAFHNIYFIGIGGIGMSALARYFQAKGAKVSGYDRVETDLTRELVSEGIQIHFDDDPNLLPEEMDLVVYTPAIPDSHRELNHCRENNLLMMKRSEVLGLITKENYTLGVAGTHGKTTTSSMIAHILRYAEVNCTAFIGGITRNYASNLLLGEGEATMVVEADEYDRSFLTLHPNVAVVTSMDADHLDIYENHDYMKESFTLFAKQVNKDGVLIYKKGLPFQEGLTMTTLTYAIDEVADFYARNITIEDGYYHFDMVTSTGEMTGLSLGLPGRHNVENAVAAVAVATQIGIDQAQIRGALESFKGVKRRFEYIVQQKDLVFIDDYAHHPEELKACIGSAREMFPGKKITGVFQPHLYSRTRDFEADFVKSLELLDEVILLDIYPARELPIPGVTSQKLLNKIHVKEKALLSKEDLVATINQRKLEVLLTLGAGDIDQLVMPMAEKLLGKTK